MNYIAARIRTVLTAALLTAALLTAALLTAALLTAALLTAHADAAPRVGHIVEITFSSDSRENVAAGWIDSANRPRTQQKPILPSFDDKTRLWSSTLTYSTRTPTTAFVVYLQTSGSHASCEVAVDGAVKTRNTVNRRRGIAVCG
ncbi:hypothetical protein [Gordonia sp. CPCC 205333]|uniref:hypothetical protein n=1 Tax=Gordonia sp. CPCC 205333 TaxID=3140790 RepID=UPI003AF3DF46